jgi:hypothetical protein
VALVASCVRQLIVAIGVTGLTRRGRMGAGQCKFGRAVIERGRQPGRRRMASLASVIQHPRNVIRVRRPSIICRMAWIAIGVDQLVVAVDVAQLTCCGRMCAGQNKSRRAVIERRWFPHRRRVARLANMTESG